MARDDEIFKIVTHPLVTPNMYEVGEFGTIRTRDTHEELTFHYGSDPDDPNLPIVYLDSNGKIMGFLAQRIIAYEFCGTEYDRNDYKYGVVHKNHNIRDNRSFNLEFIPFEIDTYYDERIYHAVCIIKNKDYPKERKDKIVKYLMMRCKLPLKVAQDIIKRKKPYYSIFYHLYMETDQYFTKYEKRIICMLHWLGLKPSAICRVLDIDPAFNNEVTDNMGFIYKNKARIMNEYGRYDPQDFVMPPLIINSKRFYRGLEVLKEIEERKRTKPDLKKYPLDDNLLYALEIIDEQTIPLRYIKEKYSKEVFK